MTTDHHDPGQEARPRSRVTDASVVETVVVLTVAQVSDGLSTGVAAVVDDTDDGYIKWTMFPVHELVSADFRATGSGHRSSGGACPIVGRLCTVTGRVVSAGRVRRRWWVVVV